MKDKKPLTFETRRIVLPLTATGHPIALATIGNEHTEMAYSDELVKPEPLVEIDIFAYNEASDRAHLIRLDRRGFASLFNFVHDVQSAINQYHIARAYNNGDIDLEDIFDAVVEDIDDSEVRLNIKTDAS